MRKIPKFVEILGTVLAKSRNLEFHEVKGFSREIFRKSFLQDAENLLNVEWNNSWFNGFKFALSRVGLMTLVRQT